MCACACVRPYGQACMETACVFVLLSKTGVTYFWDVMWYVYGMLLRGFMVFQVCDVVNSDWVPLLCVCVWRVSGYDIYNISVMIYGRGYILV